MSKPKQPESSPVSGEEINITPGFEEKLQLFWENNRRGILVLCLVVLVAIVARGGWDYLADQKEQGIQLDYATATTTEQLKNFASTNAGHELAGVAWLQVADAAYAEGKSTDAVEAYQKSHTVLPTGPLGDRAALGIAMAQLQAGLNSEGAAGLKLLADSDAMGRGVRTEAAYQLASLAYSAGKTDAIKTLTDQIMQIDPASPWAQRALTLQMKSSVGEIAPAAPAASAKAASEAEPVIKLNLGGK